MKAWKLKVEFDGMSSVVPLKARSIHSAIALMANEVAKRHVGEPRFDRGKITILDPNDNERYVINQDDHEGKYIDLNKKENVTTGGPGATD